MNLNSEELAELKLARSLARDSAIAISKRFKIIKTVYHITQADYDNKIREYTRLDRDYAFALHDKESKKLKLTKSGKAYDPAKRAAQKALKALESLPEEMRAKIIADAQNGLF